MPAKTASSLQRVIVFATDPHSSPPCPSELAQDFPQAEITVINPSDAARLFPSLDGTTIDWTHAIAWLRQHQFDAALVLTAPGQSPYTLGYLCYLAGIPIRIGHSHEFGGQVFSHDLYEFWEGGKGEGGKGEGRRGKGYWVPGES